MSDVNKDVQQVWKENFDTYAKCEDYLEYWIKTYGETDKVDSFSITKVVDNDWRLIILYS